MALTKARLLKARFPRSRIRNWPFFTQISGRNFLPELCGEVHPETAPLQALYCALCYGAERFLRGRTGRKGAQKREEEGWPVEGAKRKKGRVKTGQGFHQRVVSKRVVLADVPGPQSTETSVPGPKTEKKQSIHHCGYPPFILFQGLRPLWCIPFFPDLWCIPLFPLFPRKIVYTKAFLALWPRGRATDRERRGATVVVYILSRFPWQEPAWGSKTEPQHRNRNEGTFVGLPRKQKIAVNKFWVQESEIGEECRQFWTWILGVNFLGGLKPWKNKAEKIAIKIRSEFRRQFS